VSISVYKVPVEGIEPTTFRPKSDALRQFDQGVQPATI